MKQAVIKMAEEQKKFRKRPEAARVFSCEFKDSKYVMKDDDDPKSPSFVITPLGAKINRIFFVGAMTFKERKDDKNHKGFYKAIVTDGTGDFYLSSNSYTPESMTQMSEITVTDDKPVIVAVVGKVTVSTSEDGKIYRQVRVESIVESNIETRNMWRLEAAKQTADRIANVKNGDSILSKEYYGNVDTKKYEEPIQILLNSF